MSAKLFPALLCFPGCLASTTKACSAYGSKSCWQRGSGRNWIITKFPVGLPVFVTIGQARPGSQRLFEWAKGLAYLWLQQVRSTENPFVHRSWLALANSGQADGHGAQALGYASS
jgi:hypothetical protein